MIQTLKDYASPDQHLVVRINHWQDDGSAVTLCDVFILPSIPLLKVEHSGLNLAMGQNSCWVVH